MFPQAYTWTREGLLGGEQMSRPKKKGRGSKPQWAAAAQQEIQEQIVQAESAKAVLNRRALDNEDTSDEIRDAHADTEEALQQLTSTEVHIADVIYEIENGPSDRARLSSDEERGRRFLVHRPQLGCECRLPRTAVARHRARRLARPRRGLLAMARHRQGGPYAAILRGRASMTPYVACPVRAAPSSDC